MNILEQLKERISREKTKSLDNVNVWRLCGAREAQLNSNGEVIAFAMVLDMIETLEKQKESNERKLPEGENNVSIDKRTKFDSK
jgi:hypothetical protein